ncbi:urea carboxylase [Aureimonas sp. SA4125]|uniref:urea amidolyase associated protein UAAP1 n=1 Tax=Aureimonas sp. SA4125 TaxID=2826993 RepID=UPI001CC5806E|nr:urea amidolyase associated protein UAAP1 [Aureimonas sp. SA4125]BDA84402.1 urea carboxylase [Aureimonas sp. SA4125]
MPQTEDARAATAEHRRRYDALKSAGTGVSPEALPGPTAPDAVPIDPATVVGRETIPGGWYAPLRLKRGETLRLVDVEGTAAASLLAWNAADPSERLNHADTMKIQWSARLRKGRVIFSDMGRVLLSITEDTSAAHDALAGGSTAASTLLRFGEGSFRNTRDNFIQGALKLGLSRRDIAPCVTFFAPVSVTADGALEWRNGGRQRGGFVDLRAEMDLLLVVSCAPHPLDPAPVYAPGPVEAIRFKGTEPGRDDLCRNASIEARRGFDNTLTYLAG